VNFSQYLSDYLLGLAKESRLLSVRDPEGRYRAICESLASKGLSFVDGDRTSLEVREELVPLWAALPRDPNARILLYRTGIPPEPLQDPLAGLELVGRIFPDPAAAHEEYRSLVRAAYPDRGDEVDALFSGGEPSLATVDSLAEGNRYPALTGLFGKNGPMDLILELLTADDAFPRVLSVPAAASEADTLLATTLGMPPGARSTEALWRHLLYSEFVLDFPGTLPSEFAAVPRSPESARAAVYAICRRLRSDHESRYVDEAERVAKDLDLESLTRSFDHFGQIDTFAFESAAALRSAVEALQKEDVEEASRLISTSALSIWSHHDYRLQSSWELLRQTLLTLEALKKAPARDCNYDPATWYRGAGFAVDRSYRSFIFTLSRLEDEAPYGARLLELSETLSTKYRDWLDSVQALFVDRVRKDGWPLPGLLRQDRVFQSDVAPHLAKSRRVAYFLVDALRYELGDALASKLESDYKVNRSAAAALLPTKTALGMAALAPDTSGPLSIHLEIDGWTVLRGGSALAGASDRDALYHAYKGDQVLVETLEQWLSRGPRQKPDTKIQLAVIRSTEIDSAGEVSDSVFRSSLENLMTSLARGVRKSFALGFDRAVLCSDHGFLYVPIRKPGDQVSPPAGDIQVKGDRYAFGTFEPSESLLTLTPERLGYPLVGGLGKTPSLAVPVSTGSFSKPGAYVHGGLSLQEALIPVLAVEPVARKGESRVSVTLTYRDKKRARATSLTPGVTIAVASSAPALGFEEEWAQPQVEVEIRILATGGSIIGAVGPNEFLDPDTGFLRIRPGTTTTLPLRLSDEFRGACTVAALDPATGRQYDSIELDVDILD
jgi:hypothetical protein